MGVAQKIDLGVVCHGFCPGLGAEKFRSRLIGSMSQGRFAAVDRWNADFLLHDKDPDVAGLV